MGQARRRRTAWGSHVVHPATYVPVEPFWMVVAGSSADPSSLRAVRSLVRTDARVHRSMPCLFRPDRDPLAPCGIDFEEPDASFVPETDEDGNAVFFHDEDLGLVRRRLGDRVMFALLGQPGRVAVRTGDPVEVAIDAAGNGFVLKDGSIPDPSFFADKMIVPDRGPGVLLGDSLTLTMAAVLRADPAGRGRDPSVVGIAKHLDVFDRSTDEAAARLPGAEIDRVVFRAVRKFPEMLLDGTDGMKVGDVLPHALGLFRDAYRALLKDRAARIAAALHPVPSDEADGRGTED